MSETDDEKFIAWAQKKVGIYLTDTDEARLFALARRGAAMQTLGAHEFDPDPFFPTHCKCGRRFENNVHDLPPTPKGAEG